MTIEEMRGRLRDADLLGFVKDVRYVLHPDIYSKLFARPYRTIFADATSYRHAEKIFLQPTWDLTLHTLYGHYDFAASAFLSDERLTAIIDSVRPFCRTALPFRADTIYQMHRCEITPFDVGSLDDEKLKTLAACSDPIASGNVAPNAVAELRELGAVLGTDLLLHSEKTHFVRGVIGIRLDEHAGNLESIDRLALTLREVDRRGYIRTLVSGSGRLLPYTVIMEVEAPHYHSLDQFTDLLIDKDLETRTIFVAKTLREGVASARKDSPQGSAVPAHLEPAYSKVAQLPVEIVRTFDRQNAERKYKILNRLQHIDRLAKDIPAVTKHIEAYTIGLVRGDHADQVRAFAEVAKCIEYRLGTRLRTHFETVWGDDWERRVKREYQVTNFDDKQSSLKAVGGIVAQMRQRHQFRIGDAAGCIPKRECAYLVDAIEEIRPMRNLSSHVSEEGMDQSLIVDLPSFEVAVYDGLLKAIIALGIIEKRFADGLPVKKRSPGASDELIVLIHRLNVTGEISSDTAREDLVVAAPILREELGKWPALPMTLDLQRVLLQRVRQLQDGLLSGGDGGRRAKVALQDALKQLGAEMPGDVSMEPLVTLIEEVALQDVSGPDGPHRVARLLAREVAKQFASASRG